MSTVALILGNLDLIAGVATALLGADALHALPKSVRFVRFVLTKRTPADDDLRERLAEQERLTAEMRARLSRDEQAVVDHEVA